MFAYKGKSLFVMLVIVAVVLAITPFAGAQEGTPTPQGLRPDAPPYAVHGPYAVGVMEFEGETSLHPTKIAVWYPALNPAGAEETITYDFPYWTDLGVMPVAGHALRDAAPDASTGPYPLIVYVHGLGDQRLGSFWLCEHLASYGFVVASMDQIDNAGREDTEGAGLLRRPQDVTWLIDYAANLTATGGKLDGQIDMERVAVVGVSFGGYTAVAAGGARIDWDYFQSWCQENHDNPQAFSIGLNLNFCDVLADDQTVLAPLAGLDASQTGLWPSWGDPRVDAIVPLVPAFWMVFGPEGVRNISVPMLIMGGSGDTIVPPEWDSFYENVSSTKKALVIFANANHLIFGPNCDAVSWLVDLGGFGSCSDAVWDINRVHDLSDHFITAFLLSVLYGDKDAAAALAADQVQFPGITYETTGF